MRFLQFIAVLALGAVVAWVARRWFGLFESETVAAVVWIGILLAVGFLVDRRSDRQERRDKAALASMSPEMREQVAREVIGRPLTDAEKIRLGLSTQGQVPGP
jgi:Flp pilus assembly protein TadB